MVHYITHGQLVYTSDIPHTYWCMEV